MNDQAPRQHFSSGFGVVMALMAVAVGLGNVWRFPYMAAAFGGGAFVLVYLLVLVLFGIPAFMAELALGRMTRRGPMGAFTSIGMPMGRSIGWALFVTIFMALSYYTVIVGWVLRYFLVSVTAKIDTIQPSAFFDDLLAGFAGQFVMTGIVLAMAAAVLTLGIRDGIERISKVGMPLLFVLMLVLIVRTVTLPGVGEGLRFYFSPDFARVDAAVITAALGQVFFSLGLGGTFLLTYASYLPSTTNLKSSAISVGLGETAASILAGLVIVPAAVVFGLDLESGPSLTFVTVPSIFGQMQAGSFFGALFFGLLFFVAFLSVVAGIEVLVTSAVDVFGWKRRNAAFVFCGTTLILGTVAMVSIDFALTSDLFWGSTMQPVGSALALIALAWVVGLRRALDAVNEGNERRPVGKLWYYWIKYVIPTGIFIILAVGLQGMFGAFFG